MMRWDIINDLLDRSSERRYLEIGVNEGLCGAHVKSFSKWGVDVVDHGEYVFENFYHGPSDAFFLCEEARDLVFDVVLVDGLHHADQVYRDVLNAAAHLSDGGAIVLHDCNPRLKQHQQVPRGSPHWNGDCWKAVVRLRAKHPEFDVLVVNTDEGVGVVTRSKSESTSSEILSTTNVDELRWEHLCERRELLLGLIHTDDWNGGQVLLHKEDNGNAA